MKVYGYHGTTYQFDPATLHKPVYFGHSIETAQGFAKDHGYIIEACIEANKVLAFDACGESWASLWTDIEEIDNAVWDYIMHCENCEEDEEEME